MAASTGVVLVAACSDGGRLEGTAADSVPAGSAADSTEEASSTRGLSESASLDSAFDAALDAYWDAEYDSAHDRLDAVRREADRRNDHRIGAMARTWIGYSAWRLGEYETARRVGEDAVEMELRYGLDDLLPRSYNQLGLVAWHQARNGRALDLFERSAAAARAVDSEPEALKARANQATILVELGQFRRARVLYEERLTAARRDADTLAIADVLTNLGMLEVAEGRPEAAVTPVREALPLYRAGGYPARLETAYAQLGTAYAAMGQLGRAHALFDSALAIARETDDRPAIAYDTEILAEIYWEAGRWQRALELYAAAREVNEALGHRLELGSVLRSEAGIRLAAGQLAAAEERVRRALALHTEIGARWEAARDRILLAEVLARQQRWTLARALVDTVEAAGREFDTRAARVAAGLAAARLAEAQGDGQRVLSVLMPLSEDLQRSGSAEEWEAASLEARAWLSTGAPERGVAAGSRAIGAIDRMQSGFGSGQLRTSFVAARRDTYAMQVEALLRLGRIGEAFEVADAARAPTAEWGGGAAARAPAPSAERDEQGAALLNRIEALVAAADSVEARSLADGLDRGEELAELRRQLATTRGAYEARLISLAEAGEHSRSMRADADADLVQASLGPSEALLEYLMTADQLLVFVVTREAITVAQSDLAPADLRSRTRLLRQLMADPRTPPARIDPILEALYTELIGPAIRTGRLADVGRLVVVPHQWLTYVPFGALVDPTSDRRLIESVDVRLLPSGAQIASRPHAEGRRRRSTSIGVTAFAPYPDELPATRREVEAVTGLVRPARRRIGVEASEAAFRQALSESRIVHAATHGRLNSLNPLFSRLEFAGPGRAVTTRNDGRLEVHELPELNVAADLVVLSGCETALGQAGDGRFAPGEDYMTMALGFLRAGAGSVVATLWSIDDDGAAVFAERFYHSLESSGSSADVAAALAAAQRTMLTDAKYSHPYYWAGYVVTGRGH